MTTAITVPNGAATPVNKTFSVSRSAVGDESAVLHIREGAATVAYPKAEFSTRNVNSNGSKGRQGVMTLVIPYGYTDANGNFVKVDEVTFVGRSKVPDTAPDAVRKDLAAFTTGLYGNQQLKDTMIIGYAS